MRMAEKCQYVLEPLELATWVLCELSDEAAELFFEWSDEELMRFDVRTGRQSQGARI